MSTLDELPQLVGKMLSGGILELLADSLHHALVAARLQVCEEHERGTILTLRRRMYPVHSCSVGVRAVLDNQKAVRISPVVLASAGSTPAVKLPSLLLVGVRKVRRHPPHVIFQRGGPAVRADVRQRIFPSLFSWSIFSNRTSKPFLLKHFVLFTFSSSFQRFFFFFLTPVLILSFLLSPLRLLFLRSLCH